MKWKAHFAKLYNPCSQPAGRHATTERFRGQGGASKAIRPRNRLACPGAEPAGSEGMPLKGHDPALLTMHAENRHQAPGTENEACGLVLSSRPVSRPLACTKVLCSMPRCAEDFKAPS